MANLVILRGLPGSGKTTEAMAALGTESDWVRSNRDDLRMMLYGTKKDFTYGREELVTKVQQESVKAALKSGKSVIVDDTNLRPKYVRAWRKIAKACGADFYVEEMDADVETCILRDSKRSGEDHVGEDVIRMLAGKFMTNGKYLPVPEEDEPGVGDVYVPDVTKPDAIIVDIDGTVANANGRDIYSIEGVEDDLPIMPIINAVNAAVNYGCDIVFMSGRDESCREATRAWLFAHTPYDDDDDILLMRPTGDKRRDSIVKQELFDKHVRHQYNVQYVLDDRNQVVEMWRSMGLTCLQVAPGDF